MSKILYQGERIEQVEKKSRFIARAYPIDTEDTALLLLNGVRKQYYNASHHCFAYVLGEQQETQRFSDDGEPSGTAGKPILEVLLQADIHHVLLVVTRYFGGTLLGSGGLIRAYAGAARAALQQAVVLEKEKGMLVEIRADYTDLGKLQYELRRRELLTLETVYADQVLLKTVIALPQLKAFVQQVTELTGGRAKLNLAEECEFGRHEGEVILL